MPVISETKNPSLVILVEEVIQEDSPDSLDMGARYLENVTPVAKRNSSYSSSSSSDDDSSSLSVVETGINLAFQFTDPSVNSNEVALRLSSFQSIAADLGKATPPPLVSS